MCAKVAIIQTDIRPDSIENNLRQAEEMIASVPHCDLYVLPETFATGFDADPTQAAKAEKRIVDWVSDVAKKSNCAISGTLIVERNGRYRNRHIFATPDLIEHYDKRHLFSIGGEGEKFDAGTERKVVEWRGIRWLLATCYDLRFPVWLRNRGDYDAMICAASWPAARGEVWRTLLQARAIENVAYVVGANRIGNDSSTSYQGDSMICDYRGGKLAESGNNVAVLCAEIEREELEAFRRKFPVECDADDFELLTEKRANR